MLWGWFSSVLQIFGEAGQTVKIPRHELGHGRSAGGCANVTFTYVSGADGHETIPNTVLSGPLDLQNITFTAASRAPRSTRRPALAGIEGDFLYGWGWPAAGLAD